MDATSPPTTVPIRQQARFRDPAERAARLQEHARLLDDLAANDRELTRHACDRQEILQQLASLRDALWPKARWSQGRQGRPGRLDDPLPPLPARTTWLVGRRLRAECLRLLQLTGPLPLRDLHALLHRHGFGVAGPNPTKALADAMGHEVEHGRARRHARATYGVANGHAHDVPTHTAPTSWD